MTLPLIRVEVSISTAHPTPIRHPLDRPDRRLLGDRRLLRHIRQPADGALIIRDRRHTDLETSTSPVIETLGVLSLRPQDSRLFLTVNYSR